MKPDEVVYRLLQRLPARVLSLRTIVIVAALSVVIVLTLGTLWVGVTHDQYSQLDRRRFGQQSRRLQHLLTAAPRPRAEDPLPDGSLVQNRPDRNGGHFGTNDVVLPSWTSATPTPRSTASNTAFARSLWRAPRSRWGAARRDSAPHRRVALAGSLICAGVIVGTVVIGWLISLIMINPFRLLAQQARAISAQSKPTRFRSVGCVRAVEIGEAVEECSRASATNRRAAAALESAAISRLWLHTSCVRL